MPETGAARSQWFVAGLTVLALLFGWALRTAALSSTRSFDERGVHVELPAAWLVQTSDGGLNGRETTRTVLSSWDPLDPGTVYSVQVLPAAPDASLATIASFHNLERARTETAYRVLEQTPVTLSGRDGYRVLFAYVDAGQMGEVPVVYQGADYFFMEDGSVLVATLETQHDFEQALSGFREFAATMRFGEAP